MRAIAEPMFPRGRAGLASMLRFLKGGGWMALGFDQYDGHGTELRFFGQPTKTVLTPAELALMLGIEPGKGAGMTRDRLAELVARYPDAPVVPRTVLCNPVVTPLSDEEEEGWEGCLSVPGLRGVVPRWRRIRYSGFDPYGDPIEREVEGFHARVVQHECDHLIGKLYPMRVRDFTRFGFTDVLFPGLDAAADD